MKTTFLTLFTFVFLLSSAIFSDQQISEKRIPFKVYIEQNGIRQPIINNEVTLNKKPFNLVFIFHKPATVFTSATFNESTYELALKNAPFEKLPGYEGGGMAEGLFNTDKEVFIDNTAPSCWFYDNDKEHRFNTIVKTKDGLVCTREIERLYILGDNDNNSFLYVDKISSPLYFVFIDYITDQKTYERTELQREMIKINWK